MKKFIDIIREDYPMMKKMSEVHAVSLYNHLNEQQVLTEMLGTVNHNKVVKMISRTSGVDSVDISDDNSSGGKISPAIEIIIADPENNIDNVSNKMEKLGWFPSFIYHSSGRGEKYSTARTKLGVFQKVNPQGTVRVRYEAKYDEQIDVQKPLYHVTSDLHWNSIQRIGLTPKSQGKLANHPGRIYLLQDYNQQEIYEIGTQLMNTYKNNHLIKEVCVLEIDITMLKEHKFYEDPNYHISQAVYTYQNIPPVAIKIVQVLGVAH